MTLRTVVAGFVFAVLYGIAVRVFLLMRVRRESTRWHLPAVGVATLIGGIAFYLAQQIRMPYVPTWLDIPAFAILCLGACSIPVLLELGVVIPARFARRMSIRVPPTSGHGATTHSDAAVTPLPSAERDASK